MSDQRRADAALGTAALPGWQITINRLRRRWLLLLNLAVFAFLAGAFAAPALLLAGFPALASLIYDLYGFTCHQLPFRSFFVFGPQFTYNQDAIAQVAHASHLYTWFGSAEHGFKLAFCQRDLGIYGALLLSGLAYGRVRGHARPLSLLAFGLLCAPIALDGFTQMFGWRESIWELRLLTGALFGVAACWFLYPRLERVLGPTSPSTQVRLTAAHAD